MGLEVEIMGQIPLRLSA